MLVDSSDMTIDEVTETVLINLTQLSKEMLHGHKRLPEKPVLFRLKRAVDVVYDELDKGGIIYTYGSIIHNETVVEELGKEA